MENYSSTPDIHFRHAEFLDIPYIFSLITDASLFDGTFTNNILTGSGYLSLFFALIAALNIFRLWHQKKSLQHELLIIEAEGESVGFIHCTRIVTVDKPSNVYIKQCAIAPQHRNKGLGKKMVQWIIERESSGRCFITAHCNRYARAMQHIFKRQHFIRQSVGKGLELYVFEVNADSMPTSVSDTSCEKGKSRSQRKKQLSLEFKAAK